MLCHSFGFLPRFIDEKQHLSVLNLCVSVTGGRSWVQILRYCKRGEEKEVGLGGGWGQAELWCRLTRGPSQGHRVLWGWKGPLGMLSWEDRLRALFPRQSIIWWELPWKEMSPWLFFCRSKSRQLAAEGHPLGPVQGVGEEVSHFQRTIREVYKCLKLPARSTLIYEASMITTTLRKLHMIYTYLSVYLLSVHPSS